MPKSEEQKTIQDYGIETIQKTHDLFLEALRNREQEILRYLAILVPALGGYGWLIHSALYNISLFTVGTIGVILLLFLGAIYSLALGYNFRYITLQLAKFDAKLQITDAMLQAWPRSKEDFLKKYRRDFLPRCEPPELIKIFWLAFMVGIGGVAISAIIIKPHIVLWILIIPISGICLHLTWRSIPEHYGRKLHELAKDEPEEWEPLVMGVSAKVDANPK